MDDFGVVLKIGFVLVLVFHGDFGGVVEEVFEVYAPGLKWSYALSSWM
jgi:hypothetical protein